MNNDAARQEQLIKRIRKLLALSRNNSNPHEAAQALSRAAWVTGQRPPRCGGWWCINSPKV